MGKYLEYYLDDVMDNLGRMAEFSCDNCLDICDFWQQFVDSKVAKGIEDGHPRYLSGYSSIELFEIITNKIITNHDTSYIKVYWAASSIGYLQWKTGISFREIEQKLPIKGVIEMFYPLHETDIYKFLDKALRILNK